MKKILFLIGLVLGSEIYSMELYRTDFYETERDFRNSLDEYEVGTEWHPLVTQHFTLQIEGNGLIYCDKFNGRKEEIINLLFHKITHFSLSPNQTKIIALQCPVGSLCHSELKIIDFLKNSVECKLIKDHFDDGQIYTHLSISDNNTIAIGNDEIQYVHQCAYPEKNIKEKPLYRSYTSSHFNKKLISLKFNKQGTYFGINKGNRAELFTLPDFN